MPRRTKAPVLLKWFVSRDVPTGAPSSNGTIILIHIPSFPLLVYLLTKRERTRRRKGQRLQPNGNEQGRNDKM
nr:cytochrome c biogenesis FC, mitochondrial [Tanacetum cinerariifolium]